MKPTVSNHKPVRQVYDQLWTEAMDHFSRGEIDTDPYLQHPETDFRRGITLIVRPNPAVTAQFTTLVNELRALEPEQYFYQPEEFHLTILTLISASVGFVPQKTSLAVYDSIFTSLFKEWQPFSITFQGITASAGAVLAQGFVACDSLNKLRESIRQALQSVGLAGSLDVRYKIITAHVTLMRFQAALQNLPQLMAKLGATRDHPFGVSEVEQIEFVMNDWYMSSSKVETITTYSLTLVQGRKAVLPQLFTRG